MGVVVDAVMGVGNVFGVVFVCGVCCGVVGDVAVVVGKRSFTDEQITENAEAAIKALFDAKPNSVSGRFVKSLTLSATMSPGVSIDTAPYVKN